MFIVEEGEVSSPKKKSRDYIKNLASSVLLLAVQTTGSGTPSPCLSRATFTVLFVTGTVFVIFFYLFVIHGQLIREESCL